MKILITGSAGFIGFHLAKKLLNDRHTVLGIDNFSKNYSIQLKKIRNSILEKYTNFQFKKININNKKQLQKIFIEFNPDIVVNLAAQAGVRYSIINPDIYLQSNIIGFFNILECCRYTKVKPILLYASSSSVYGNITNSKFKESIFTDKPLSFYAATKKSNEVMAYCYSYLYQIKILGFRFFTVYGPFGRPDMAYFDFTKKLLNNQPIKLFNNGNMYRDFTYIDDVIDCLFKCIKNINLLPNYEIYNIGSGHYEKLSDMVSYLINILKIKNPKIEFLPIQASDAYFTYASIEKIQQTIGYQPKVLLNDGLQKFYEWFKTYKHII